MFYNSVRTRVLHVLRVIYDPIFAPHRHCGKCAHACTNAFPVRVHTACKRMRMVRIARMHRRQTTTVLGWSSSSGSAFQPPCARIFMCENCTRQDRLMHQFIGHSPRNLLEMQAMFVLISRRRRVGRAHPVQLGEQRRTRARVHCLNASAPFADAVRRYRACNLCPVSVWQMREASA